MLKTNKKKILTAKYNWLKIQHPNMAEKELNYMCFYEKSDNSTNGLTRCIIDYITYLGYQAERISTTGQFRDNRKTFKDVLGRTRQIGSTEFVKGAGTKGSADISATIPMNFNGNKVGVSVKIEVKFAKDRQSEYQKDYERNINNAGGIYFIARDFDQFIDWFEKTF